MLFPALRTCRVLIWCLDRTGLGRAVLTTGCVYALVSFAEDGYGVYIGTTNLLARRIREHVRDARAVLRGRLPTSRTRGLLDDQARAGGAALVVALEELAEATRAQAADAELAWLLAALRHGVQPVTSRLALTMIHPPFWPNSGDRLAALLRRSERLVWPTTWLEVLRRGLAAGATKGPDLELPVIPDRPHRQRTPSSDPSRVVPDGPLN